MNAALAAESSGKSPRLFSSRRTLFGIPSALDQELAKLDESMAESRPAQSRTSAPTAMPAHAVHPLEPVFDERSRVLILGAMPSPESREAGFYFSHPDDRFWKVMAALFDEKEPETNDEKRDFALAHGIALWDVLAEYTIEGSWDGTLAECVPNDLLSLLAKAPIEAIFCTGERAAELYGKYVEPSTGITCKRLPSTGPANTVQSFEQLADAYRQIVPYRSAASENLT